VESPLGYNLRTIQGDRVVLGQVGVCAGCWTILLVGVDKTRALERPSTWSCKFGYWSILSVRADK